MGYSSNVLSVEPLRWAHLSPKEAKCRKCGRRIGKYSRKHSGLCRSCFRYEQHRKGKRK